MTDLTTSEVSAVLDLDERRVRKDVEHGVFEDIDTPPRFDLPAIVYLHTVAHLGIDLGVEDRKRLYRQLVVAIRGGTRKVLELSEYLTLRLEAALAVVEQRLGEFDAWKQTLVVRPDILGGEPAFPRSRLAVRHIGELARRGASVDAIREDYPGLSRRDIELAKRYVAAYPRLGRPRAGEAPAR